MSLTAHPPEPGDLLGMGIGVGPRKASDVLNERTDNLVRPAVDWVRLDSFLPSDALLIRLDSTTTKKVSNPREGVFHPWLAVKSLVAQRGRVQRMQGVCRRCGVGKFRVGGMA